MSLRAGKKVGPGVKVEVDEPATGAEVNEVDVDCEVDAELNEFDVGFKGDAGDEEVDIENEEDVEVDEVNVGFEEVSRQHEGISEDDLRSTVQT